MAPLASRLSFPSLSAARKHNQAAPLVISAPQKLRPTSASCKKRGRENECPVEAEDSTPRSRRRTASIWNGVIRKRRQPAPPTSLAEPAAEPRRSLATTLFGDTPSVRLRKSSASSRRAPIATPTFSRQPSYASIAARPRAPTPGAVAASALPGPRGRGARSIFRRIRKSLTRSRGSSLCTGSSASRGDSDSEHFSEWVLSSEPRRSCSPPPVPPKPEWVSSRTGKRGPGHQQRLSSRAGYRDPLEHLAGSLDPGLVEDESMEPVSDQGDDDSDDQSSVKDYGEIIRDSHGLLRLGASDLSLSLVLLRMTVVNGAEGADKSIACQLGLHITVEDEERWHSSALAAPDISLLDVRLSSQPSIPSPPRATNLKPSRRWLCQPTGPDGALLDCRRQPGLTVSADWTRTNCDVRTLASKSASDWRSARGWIKTVSVEIPARWLARGDSEAGKVSVAVCAWLSDESADFLRGSLELDAAELRGRMRMGNTSSQGPSSHHTSSATTSSARTSSRDAY